MSSVVTEWSYQTNIGSLIVLQLGKGLTYVNNNIRGTFSGEKWIREKNLGQISSQSLKLSSYKTLYSQVGRDAQLE